MFRWKDGRKEKRRGGYNGTDKLGRGEERTWSNEESSSSSSSYL